MTGREGGRHVVKFDARAGWPPDAPDDDVLERLGEILVPQRFCLDILNLLPNEGFDLVARLLFVVRDNAVLLVGVMSDSTEVPEALTAAREHGSIADLKSLALASLAARQAMTDGDDPGVAIRRAAGVQTSGRKNRITNEHLREVADIYRTAWQSGDYPTRAVAEHFHKPHSTAARWVMAARKAGLLGQAAGPQGGETS